MKDFDLRPNLVLQKGILSFMHFGFGEKERHRLREKKEKPLLVISSPCKQEMK